MVWLPEFTRFPSNPVILKVSLFPNVQQKETPKQKGKKGIILVNPKPKIDREKGTSGVPRLCFPQSFASS